MAKKRTVVKTKAADGSKSKVVTRKMKDGSTKVKSKTKSGGVVTKRKVKVGPKKTTDMPTTSLTSQKVGNREMYTETKKSTQSVRGKETVKNRNAKKGEARKTKSKIDGTRTTTKRIAEMTTIPTSRPRVAMKDGYPTPKMRRYMQEQNKASGPRSTISTRTSTRTTPAARTTVKTKVKKNRS